MKKRNAVCLLLLVCMIAGMMLPVCAADNAAAQANEARYYTQGVITGNNVRLRSEPDLSTDQNVLYLLPKGQDVRIISQTYSSDSVAWYYVMTYYEGANQYGYVAAQYVRIVSGS